MPDAYLIPGTTTDLQEKEGTTVGGTNAQSGDLVALDGSGKIDMSVIPLGIGQEVYAGTAAEALTAGDFVYRSAAGIARASAAAGGNPARGFVLANAAQGEPVTMYLDGPNTSLSGLIPGTNYYLSSTAAGKTTDTPPTGTGKILQFLGPVLTATSLAFESGPSIRRA